MPKAPLEGRRLIRHPAHRTVGVSSAPAGWRACRIEGGEPVLDPPPWPLAVCVIVDEREPLHDIALREVCSLLAGELSAACFRRVDLRSCQWPDWRQIDRCDCAVLLGSPPPAIEAHVHMARLGRSGTGIVAVCPARPGAASPDEPSLAIFGGARCELRAGGPIEIRPAGAARHHPVLAGVEPFAASDGVCVGTDLAEDAVILMTASVRGVARSVAWARGCFPGRVFCTSLGRAGDFRQPGFIRLLANAAGWTARLDD
jgi:hypothetical protein